jgi:ubiquinone/menaquinone biosynthesis C-methylase UbiE
MGWYASTIAPRLLDKAMGGALFAKGRALICGPLTGEVVEIGFGSGHNVPHYPAAVTHVYAVEPSDLARRLAARRVAASPVPVSFVGLVGEAIPLADASVDHALMTFTLCSVQDPRQVLREIRRVMRPGGHLYLIEHGLAPEGRVRRWQHRLNRLEQRVADGCQLTREPVSLLAEAGYTVDLLTQRFPGRPTPWTYITMATASPA